MPDYVLSIDPGTRQSAILAFDGTSVSPITLVPTVQPNELALEMLRQWPLRERPPLLIETVESYGQRVGIEVFDTVRWTGRFQEAWESRGGIVHLVPRRAVKAHLCGTQKANDTDIRQALLFRFGDGTRQSALGTKESPGPLFGIKTHLWPALAVAVTWMDQQKAEG